MDLSKPEHVEEDVGMVSGVLICLFKFRTQVSVTEDSKSKNIMFHTLRSCEYGYNLLYTVKPRKVCYDMKISRILGPVPIFRNPGMTRARL